MGTIAFLSCGQPRLIVAAVFGFGQICTERHQPFKRGAVNGRVFNDINRNGRRDWDEWFPVRGHRVYADVNGAGANTAISILTRGGGDGVIQLNGLSIDATIRSVAAKTTRFGGS